MKEMNYILQSMSDTSLIIIDELGRGMPYQYFKVAYYVFLGTSLESGYPICQAMIEELISRQVSVII